MANMTKANIRWFHERGAAQLWGWTEGMRSSSGWDQMLPIVAGGFDSDVDDATLTLLLDALTTQMFTEQGVRWPLTPKNTVTVQSLLYRMLVSPQMTDVALMGTVWRVWTFVMLQTRMTGGGARGLLRWVGNPACPLPVAAQACVMDEEGAESPKNALALEALLGRVSNAYPDLADLPDALALSVVSSQPIPSDWFTDVIPLPEEVEVVAPGLVATELVMEGRT